MPIGLMTHSLAHRILGQPIPFIGVRPAQKFYGLWAGISSLISEHSSEEQGPVGPDRKYDSKGSPSFKIVQASRRRP